MWSKTARVDCLIFYPDDDEITRSPLLQRISSKMPPRKTRSSLPTPADSAKSAETPSTSSAASTPAVSASGRGNKASAQAGLPTPDSMTDGDDAGTEVDEEEVKPKNVRGRKRKGELIIPHKSL